MSASLPDDGATLNVSCPSCFRLHLKQLGFELEPCHFTYTRESQRRNGVLEMVVKRAHLRLGMDVLMSAYGKRTVAIYYARIRLKKFAIRVRMKYAPLVNGVLGLFRSYIKKVVEEEFTKALVGNHVLHGL